MAKNDFDPVNPIFHGLGMKVDNGSIPSVAINRAGIVVEVHRNEAGRTLYHRVGVLNRATIDWGPSRRYDSGNEPQVALNNNDIAVEVHQAGGAAKLFHRVGRVTGDKVDWGQSLRYETGINPDVAVNDHGVVVEVHESETTSKLWCRVGQLQPHAVDWAFKGQYRRGARPKIAINNSGTVVEVHQKQKKLFYCIGRVNKGTLELGPDVQFASGSHASVALTHEGLVVVTYQVGVRPSLFRRVGKIKGKSIVWTGDAIYYDDGGRSSVAAAFTAEEGTTMSVEMHEGAILNTLWFSTSMHTNRASWMEDRLDILGDRSLTWLVLPASHDAGMYPGGFRFTTASLKPASLPFPALAQTQSLSIFGQLMAGVRYFDLRPRRVRNKFVIFHGPISGPDLGEVLKDIRDFALKGHRELIILNLSHFDNIDNAAYAQMVQQITKSLGRWLVKTKPDDRRLSEITLREFVANGPAILIVVDGNFAIDVKTPGFWVFRNWSSATPAAGDLNVYDQWSNKVSFEAMKKDQLAKFARFDGRMRNDPGVRCDLFLLSWTLTPPTAVWLAAVAANRRLGEWMRRTMIPNNFQRYINLLYVDYVEFARVTDIAILANPRVLFPMPIRTPQPRRPGTAPPRVVVPPPRRR